jgi:hypothetical protein
MHTMALQARALNPTRGWGWLAAVCAMALLFSFARTVQLVVSQGVERRAQTQRDASTHWRCNTLAGPQARADCRVATR